MPNCRHLFSSISIDTFHSRCPRRILVLSLPNFVMKFGQEKTPKLYILGYLMRSGVYVHTVEFKNVLFFPEKYNIKSKFTAEYALEIWGYSKLWWTDYIVDHQKRWRREKEGSGFFRHYHFFGFFHHTIPCGPIRDRFKCWAFLNGVNQCWNELHVVAYTLESTPRSRLHSWINSLQ